MELSTVHISVALSVVVVFVGGWYLQSSLMEEHMNLAGQIEQLKHTLIEEQYHTMVQTGQIEKLQIKVRDLDNTIKGLSNDRKEDRSTDGVTDGVGYHNILRRQNPELRRTLYELDQEIDSEELGSAEMGSAVFPEPTDPTRPPGQQPRPPGGPGQQPGGPGQQPGRPGKQPGRPGQQPGPPGRPPGPPGRPGPPGPPGRAGPPGHAGPPGRPGQTGRGYRGPPGWPGDEGRVGQPGKPGKVGPKGEIGRKGSKGKTGGIGLPGSLGKPGRAGGPGKPGQVGTKGEIGRTGPKGSKGETGGKGLPGSPGKHGSKGRAGKPGLVGPKGEIGKTGKTAKGGKQGQKGDSGGGVVYIRWGKDSCPTDTGAQLVYIGSAAGPHFDHNGGGSNPQCLPNSPSYSQHLDYHSGRQDRISYMHGAVYERTHRLVGNTNNGGVPCAVCYVPTRTSMYMYPAESNCPSGWTTEYNGYLMSEASDHYRTQYLCVDGHFDTVSGSSNRDISGLEFFPVEARCEKLSCPPYDETKELNCAVCTR